MASTIDSNVAYYERAVRELPAATLSITLPILLIGLESDDKTEWVDVRQCRFDSLKEIVGRGKAENRWRIINGYVSRTPMSDVGPDSETGPMLEEDEEGEQG